MGLSLSPEDMDAFLHFWRGIGYLLGIEDKYNLCNGNTDQMKSLCQFILDKKYKPSITESPEVSNEMSRAIVNSFRPYIWILTYEGLIKYIYQIIDIQKDIKLNLFTFISYHILKFGFNYVLHIRIFSLIFNIFLRFVLYVVNTNWAKNYIEKSLAVKYDIVFTETFGNLKVEEI